MNRYHFIANIDADIAEEFGKSVRPSENEPSKVFSERTGHQYVQVLGVTRQGFMLTDSVVDLLSKELKDACRAVDHVPQT